MGKKKFFVTLMAFVLVFSAFVLIMNQKGLSAAECRLIRIYGEPGGQIPFGLEPDITNIRSGSCLVWVNLAREQEVKVIFEEGKKCEDVTDAPVGFRLDPDNCYVTDRISLGGTSSLRFNETCTYKYVVEAAGGVIKERGEFGVQ